MKINQDIYTWLWLVQATSVISHNTQARQEELQALVSIELIAPASFRLRSEVDEDLDELKSSIVQHGMLHPLTLRRVGRDSYEVVAGNRRLAVAKQLGMSRIPANIIDADDKKAYEISLVENVQRKTLNPIDEARGFLKYVRARNDGGLGYGSVSALAARIGKSQEYVSNRLSLLRLPEPTMHLLMTTKGFTVSHAEVLASISDNESAVSMLTEQLSTHKISVRELERAVHMIKAGVEIQRAIELAKIETWYDLGESSAHQTKDGANLLLGRIKMMLKMSLRYIDNASDELPESPIIRKHWFTHVRKPIHDSIDAIIKAQKQVQRSERSTAVRKSSHKRDSITDFGPW